MGKIPWKAWKHTPVFLSGESHGQRSLTGVAQSGTRLKRLSVHTHMWGCNDNCLQKRSYSGYCRHKFQTQPTFKKPVVTGKFSSHPLRKEKNTKQSQDKMLRIPNYYRKNANQNDNEKSDLTRLAILTSLQTINAS